MAGFQSQSRSPHTAPVSHLLMLKLTTGRPLLDHDAAIRWAPGPAGMPQVCLAMNETPATKKSDHDFVPKSWPKERRSGPVWPRGSCTSIGRVASVVHRKLSLAHAYAFVTVRGRTEREGSEGKFRLLGGKLKERQNPHFQN